MNRFHNRTVIAPAVPRHGCQSARGFVAEGATS